MEVCDDQAHPQGLALCQVSKTYEPDRDGAFASLTYIHCTDPYYDYWRRNEMTPGGFHHFCRSAIKTCQRKVGKEGVEHITKWTPLTRHEAEQWMADQGAGKLPPLRRKLKPLDVGSEILTSAKSKSRPPVGDLQPGDEPRHGGGNSHGRTKRRRSSRPNPALEKEPLAEDVGYEPGNSSGDDEGKQAASGHRDTHSHLPRDQQKKKAPSAQDLRRKAALDAVLDEVPGDSAAPLHAVDAQKRLEELKQNLELKKREVKGVGPGAVLAAKAAKVADELKKKKKKVKKDEGVVKVLRKVFSGKSSKAAVKDEHDSEDDTDSYEDDSQSSDEDKDDPLGGSSKAAGKQRKLKRLSETKPGVLLSKGFYMMHEQLGSLYGEDHRGKGSDVLSPVALRYLLTVCLPQFKEGVSEVKMRELRTIATALDHLVSGRNGEAGDLLVQRMKSILMTMRDGSDTAARWLELLPVQTYPTATSINEDLYAKSIAVQSAKAEAALQKATGRC